MIKALIQPILIAVAVGGGVYVGQMAKDRSAPTPAYGTTPGHGESDGAHHGPDALSEAPAKSLDMNVAYLKFKRQFVIPVLGEDGVEALVLLNIAISLTDGAKDDMFNHEPQFRDAFIRELLQMSDAGYFDEALTAPSTYEAIRETLLRAARDITTEGVSDVLILDFARQDR